MMTESRTFDVDYTKDESDYTLREMVKDANFDQGDDVCVHVDDGLIVVREVDQ